MMIMMIMLMMMRLMRYHICGRVYVWCIKYLDRALPRALAVTWGTYQDPLSKPHPLRCSIMLLRVINLDWLPRCPLSPSKKNPLCPLRLFRGSCIPWKLIDEAMHIYHLVCNLLLVVMDVWLFCFQRGDWMFLGICQRFKSWWFSWSN